MKGAFYGKKITIGGRTFEQGRVYANPYASAFAPIESTTDDDMKLVNILNKSDKLDESDHDKKTQYYKKLIKREKILKKDKKDDFVYLVTDRNSDDDIFYGAVTAFHIPSGLYAGDLDVAKWGGTDDKFLEGAVEVHPDFRRQGVASQMYNISEKYFRKRFKPASPQSPDASKFWKSRK